MLRNRDVQDEIRTRWGQGMANNIQHYIEQVANPYAWRAGRQWERILRMARRNVALAYLTLNIPSVAIQPVSLLMYGYEVGWGNLMGSMGEALSDYGALRKKVLEKSVQVKHVSIERELEELKRHHPNKYWELHRKIGTHGMALHRFTDGIARTIGWNAAYEKALGEGATEEQAVAYADNITTRTQPATQPKDMPALYTTHEAVNWMVMFTNQLNKNWNIATYDIPRFIETSQGQKAIGAIVTLALQAAVISLVSRRRLPENLKEVAEMFLEPALATIPLVGGTIVNGIRGFGTEPPLFEPAKELGRFWSATDKQKQVIRILFASLALLGFPVVFAKRFRKAIAEEDITELIGGLGKKSKVRSRTTKARRSKKR